MRNFDLSSLAYISAPFTEHGRRYHVRATAKLSRLGAQVPCFAVGGETWRVTVDGSRDMRYRNPESCGCIHAAIEARIPKLAPLIRWHLCDVYGVPMHYIANALYQAERYLGLYRIFSSDPAYPTRGLGENDDPNAIMDAYHRTIVYGAAPSDERLAYGETLVTARAAMATVLVRYGIDGTNRDTLKATRILPSIHKAAREAAREAVRNALVPWLESRVPELRTAFWADLATVGLDPEKAIAEHAAYVASTQD